MANPANPVGRIALVAITRHGIRMAGRLAALLPDVTLFAPEKFRNEAQSAVPERFVCYAGKTGEQIPALFANFDAIVAIVSLGAVVRLIAPHLGSKESDPAVVVVDEAGKFAIPILSGHLGGANALAGRIASKIGATPVLTTASDSRQTLAVDLLGRELGWVIEASHDELVHLAAAVVNDEPVALIQESGEADWWTHHANGRSLPLPANLHRFGRLEEVALEDYAGVLWISSREMPADYAARLAGKCVVYRPGKSA